MRAPRKFLRVAQLPLGFIDMVKQAAHIAGAVTAIRSPSTFVFILCGGGCQDPLQSRRTREWQHVTRDANIEDRHPLGSAR
jgi:hypothetical protein